MSQNFFAALDDSGDEAPAPAKSAAKKREPKNVKKAEAPAPASNSKAVSKGDGRRRTNNNDRNTKNGRGGRSAPRDGKRAYDRRSGTGRGKEIKKGGGGARNWGSDKAEAKQMEGTINEDEVKEDKPVQDAEPTEGEEAAVVEKPEDKTITFADYMASKGGKQGTVEREVENEFKGVAVSAKVEEDFLVMGGGKQKKTKKKKDGEKKTVEVGFRVANPNAGGGGRGGRGGRGDRGGRGGRGSRDGRGRGRGRGGRGAKNSGLNVQDEAAFPSL